MRILEAPALNSVRDTDSFTTYLPN